MNQPELFYQSYEEALGDDIKASGGLKVVGKLFFPEKDVPAAGRALSDRINPGRRERLTDEQERLIIRRAREARGFSAALLFICDETGFERPKPVNLVDEQEKLRRDFIESVRLQKQIADRIERLTQAPLPAVK